MTTHWRRITERVVDDIVILDVGGGLISISPEEGRLLASIQRLVGQNHRKILLNLADVGYIDSEGLAEIVYGYKATTTAGGVLKLCGVVERIRHLLVVTRLDQHIEIYDSEREALESFAARAE